jgi:hypothetical protein
VNGSGGAAAPEVFVRREHVAIDRREEMPALVDFAAKTSYRLDRVSAAIADRLATPTTLAAVCERLRAEFDVPAVECSASVERFVADLRARDLVESYDAPAGDTELRRRYLDLLARALVNLIYPEHELRLAHVEEHGLTATPVSYARLLRDLRYTEPEAFAELVATKIDGQNWRGRVNRDAHTMVGLERLANLEACAARVFAAGVPGDFLEAGVCQGGAAIFLRGLQVAYGEEHRRTWAADSFAGLPAPEHPADVELDLDFSESRQPWLSIPLEAVQDNFRAYDLLSDAVRFLPGWFSDTLPDAPVEQLAILRIDADLYASTREVLEALYDRVVAGGYVIVDDYHAFEPCRRAVGDFVEARGIEPEIRAIDWSGVFWRKSA